MTRGQCPAHFLDERRLLRGFVRGLLWGFLVARLHPPRVTSRLLGFAAPASVVHGADVTYGR
jgi:hypothetical protein